MESVLTQVTVPTRILQDLVTRAAKGSTMQNLIPLSCLMQVKIQDQKLYVRTTDNVNYLTVYETLQEPTPNFEIVVQTKLFAALVSKLVKDATTFTVDGNKVTVASGTGKYNIALETENDGIVKFPEMMIEATPGKTILGKELKSILTLSKSCKADNKEIPCMFNYYADKDGVLTTNEYKACLNPVSLTETPLCIPSNVMDLAEAIIDEKDGISVYQTDKYIVFESVKGILLGEKASQVDLEKFPAENLIEILAFEGDTTINLNRTEWLGAVERICLFTEAFEQDVVQLVFTEDKVWLKSKTTESEEAVNYIENSKAPEGTNLQLEISAKFLRTVLTACDIENLKVSFGEKIDGIKIDNQDVKILIGIYE